MGKNTDFIEDTLGKERGSKPCFLIFVNLVHLASGVPTLPCYHGLHHMSESLLHTPRPSPEPSPRSTNSEQAMAYEASVMDTHLQGLLAILRHTHDPAVLEPALRKDLIEALDASEPTDRVYVPRVADLYAYYETNHPPTAAALHAKALLDMLQTGHGIPAEQKTFLLQRLSVMEQSAGDTLAQRVAVQRTPLQQMIEPERRPPQSRKT